MPQISYGCNWSLSRVLKQDKMMLLWVSCRCQLCSNVRLKVTRSDLNHYGLFILWFTYILLSAPGVFTARKYSGFGGNNPKNSTSFATFMRHANCCCSNSLIILSFSKILNNVVGPLILAYWGWEGSDSNEINIEWRLS